jgi:prophage DNA circulation protein
MIQEARYTSPSGLEITFSWETGKLKTELKTGIYTFPGRNGAHVQHQGAGARSFPLVCIFSGDDCMEKADQFEAMLIETGIVELQHPIYGTIKVVPTGDIEREDDTVKKIGESTVTITFTETIGDDEAAQLNEVAAEAIDEKFEEFSEAATTDFAEALESTSAGDLSDQLAVKAALEAQTQSIIDNLEPLARTNKKKFSDWLAAAKELKYKIKKLYQKVLGYVGKAESFYVMALDIGRLTLRLMKLPSDLTVALA